MAVEEVVVRAVLDDQLSSKLSSLETKLSKLSSTTSKLGGTGGTSGSKTLSDMATQSDTLGTKIETLSSKFEGLNKAIGTHLVSAAKRGMVGLVALAAAAGTAALNVTKQLQSASFVLNSATNGNTALTNQLVEQARANSDIVGLGTQVSSLRKLVSTPQFAAQASGLNQAILNISAAAGPDAGSVYSALTNASQRAENGGRVNLRALQSAGVNLQPFYSAVGYGNVSNDPILARQAQQRVMQLLPATQFNSILEGIGQQAQYKNAPNTYRDTTLSGAIGNLKLQVEEAIGNQTGPISKTLQSVFPPLIKNVTTLVNTLAPPLVKFFGSLVTSITALLPVVTPILNILSTQLSAVFVQLGKAIGKLNGAALAKSIGNLLSVLIPRIPDLLLLFVTLFNVLPLVVDNLARFAPAFIDILDAIAKMINAIGSTKIGAEAFAGLITALLALTALAKLSSGLQKLGELFDELRTLGGGKKGSGDSGSSSPSEDNGNKPSGPSGGGMCDCIDSLGKKLIEGGGIAAAVAGGLGLLKKKGSSGGGASGMLTEGEKAGAIAVGGLGAIVAGSKDVSKIPNAVSGGVGSVWHAITGASNAVDHAIFGHLPAQRIPSVPVPGGGSLPAIATDAYRTSNGANIIVQGPLVQVNNPSSNVQVTAAVQKALQTAARDKTIRGAANPTNDGSNFWDSYSWRYD